MAFFKLKMGQGAAGRKTGEENRKAVYKYFVETNPEGGIKDCAEALGLHPQTVRKHYKALAEQEAAKEAGPVTVQSVQAAQQVQPSKPTTSYKPASKPAEQKPTEDIREENASGFYSLTLSPEGIRNIPWDEPYIKERFEDMSGIEFEGLRGDVMDFIKNGGYCLKDAIDILYAEHKARKVTK